jgi:hypothetical protein
VPIRPVTEPGQDKTNPNEEDNIEEAEDNEKDDMEEAYETDKTDGETDELSTDQHTGGTVKREGRSSDLGRYTVTGKTLQALTAVYPVDVPFVVGDAKIQIPTEYISSLGLLPDDHFDVELTNAADGRSNLWMDKNGEEIVYTGTRPITVLVPHSPKRQTGGENLVVIDISGNIMPLSYYRSDGHLMIKTAKTGTFSVALAKPAEFADVDDGYVNFISSRGLLAPGRLFYPERAATRIELLDMLAKLGGEIAPASPRDDARLTYSAAVDLIAGAFERHGVACDKEKLLTQLTVRRDAVLSRYGCAKLLALAITLS